VALDAGIQQQEIAAAHVPVLRTQCKVVAWGPLAAIVS
jgi:hypothetical protein